MTEWDPNIILINFKAMGCSCQCNDIHLFSKIDDYLVIEIDSSVLEHGNLEVIKLNDSEMVPETWTIGACVRNAEKNTIGIEYVFHCKVYKNEERIHMLHQMIEFWKTAECKEQHRSDLIAELEELKGSDKPILFRCSERVAHGGSGSPCINIKKEDVAGMYIGAIPKKYYDALSENQQMQDKYLENRVERAMCTNTIREAIEEHASLEEIKRNKTSNK